MVLNDERFRPHRVSYALERGQIVAFSVDNQVRVWDENTGTCVERTQGFSEFAVIAAGSPELRWHAIRENTTAIEDAVSGRIVAWFPESFTDVASHPSGIGWAGVYSNHFQILSLEGVNAKPVSDAESLVRDFKVETDLYYSPGPIVIEDFVDAETIARLR